MSDKRRDIDPIPDEFATYEEAAELWDTHDPTDYADSFETVSVEAEFRRRRYEVEIDEKTMKMLKLQAEKKPTERPKRIPFITRNHVETVELVHSLASNPLLANGSAGER